MGRSEALTVKVEVDTGYHGQDSDKVRKTGEQALVWHLEEKHKRYLVPENTFTSLGGVTLFLIS
jgi:hypothetical protein